MNFRPLLIGACVCAVAAVFLYRKANSPAVDRTEGLVGPSAANPFVAPPGAVPLEPTAEGLSERTPAAGRPVEAAANSQPTPVAQPTPEQLLAARARIAPPGSAPIGLEGAELVEDPYGFEAKYAGQDATQIKLALDAVEAILAWQRDGSLRDKSQALPAEELAALELEQQWLKQKAFP